jgi:hypothetical protein
MCVVIQSLDARNWIWSYQEHYPHEMARQVPPYKLQKNRSEERVENERKKKVHCCDNHADESCTISMNKKEHQNEWIVRRLSTTNVLSKFADIAERQRGTGE